jgi:ATP-binding protein involved in chromosome partitioning
MMLHMIEPVASEQKDPLSVTIAWKDGQVTTLAARGLRLACPCASCVDEMTGRPLLDPGSVAEDVSIVDTDLVGRYAFQFKFSDEHDTGIFTFPNLRAMAEGLES